MPISPKVSCRIARAERQKLVKLAAGAGVTVSQLLRGLVRERLATMNVVGADTAQLDLIVAAVVEALGLPEGSTVTDAVKALQAVVEQIGPEQGSDDAFEGGIGAPRLPEPGVAGLSLSGLTALRALNRVESVPLNATDHALMAKMSSDQREGYLEARRARLQASTRINMQSAALRAEVSK